MHRSSGLLLYAATVDLLAEDFLSLEAQETLTKTDKIAGFGYVMAGGKPTRCLNCLSFRNNRLTSIATQPLACPSSVLSLNNTLRDRCERALIGSRGLNSTQARRCSSRVVQFPTEVHSTRPPRPGDELVDESVGQHVWTARLAVASGRRWSSEHRPSFRDGQPNEPCFFGAALFEWETCFQLYILYETSPPLFRSTAPGWVEMTRYLGLDAQVICHF